MLKSKCCISNYPRYIDFCHLKTRDNFGDVFFWGDGRDFNSLPWPWPFTVRARRGESDWASAWSSQNQFEFVWKLAWRKLPSPESRSEPWESKQWTKCEAGVGRFSECWYIFQGIKCRKKLSCSCFTISCMEALTAVSAVSLAPLSFASCSSSKRWTHWPNPRSQLCEGQRVTAITKLAGEEEKGCVSEEVPRSSSKVWCWHESFLGCRRWEEDHPKEEQKTAKGKGGKTMKDPEAPKKPEVPMVAALPKTAQLSWKSVLASQWRPSPNWLLPSGRSWVLMKRRSWRWIPGKESSISRSHEILCAQSGSGSGSGRSWSSREEGQDQDREGRESG